MTNKSILFFLFIISACMSAKAVQGVDPVRGKELFRQNCASCHAVGKEMVGPALPDSAGLAIDKIDPTWIFKWVRNSQGLIASHDTNAMKVYNEYKQVKMPSFPGLSDDDIRSIGMYGMIETKRLDSVNNAASIVQAVMQTKVSEHDPATLQNYFTVTHIIVFLLTIVIVIVVVVVLRAFNIVTAVLTKDEIELRRLRKLNEEKKQK